MGYKLAEQVQHNWSHLDHGPYRLILGIALALPEESRRCWFGRDRYAQLLGKAPETDAEKENAYKSVQRMIKALIGAGALQLVSAAKPGRTAVYELMFPASNGGQSTSTITEMGDAQRPPSEPEWGTVNVPNGGHSATPMEDAKRPEWGTPDVHPKKNEEEVKEESNKAPLPVAQADAHEAQGEIDLDLPAKKPALSKAALAKQIAEDFSEWYEAYPKHIGRGAATNAYSRARKNGATAEELLAGARRYAAERKGEDPKFTAQPATWLNQERWTDDPTHMGEIDVDAILGKDYWTPGAPPAGLSVSEEIGWKKEQRALHNAERLAEAKAKAAKSLSPWDPAYHQGGRPTTSQKMQNTIAVGQRLQALADARNVPRQYAWCNTPDEIEAPEEEQSA